MQAGKSITRFLWALFWIVLITTGPLMSPAHAASKKPVPPPAPSLSIPPQEYVADELLVKYKANISDLDRKNSAERDGALTVSHLKAHDKLPKNPAEQWSLVKFRQGEDLQKAKVRFNQNSDVEYVEVNYIATVGAIPNDPRFSELWGMNNTGQTGGTVNADINAPEAWDQITGDSNTIVAVIDTGVDYTHPDLAANIWTNPREIPGNGIDDDGNGYVDDVHGYDFFSYVGNPMDDYGHGTHVAGTIAAVGNNGIGVTGVNWHAKIMAVKFLGGGGSGSYADAINAINYATQMGAKILSNSWGGSYYSQALYDAIQAAGNAGALFVAAAGNSGCNCLIYPAGYDLPNIISVAATDHNDALASFSNYDDVAVDLGAPGVNILSTVPTGWLPSGLFDASGYMRLNGTSMATPHVSGAAALLKAAVPSLTWQQIKTQILTSVDPIPALSGKTVSGGRLNVQRLMGSIKFLMDISPGGQSVTVGNNSATYSVTFTSVNNYGGTLNLSIDSLGSGITGVIAHPAVALPVGGTVTTTVTLTTTPSVLQNIYHLKLNVSDQQGVLISNKFFDLTVAPQVDLVMTNVSTTATFMPLGNIATVSTTVKNQGAVATTTATTIGIYLSSDGTITTGDTLIGTRTVPGLVAGESSAGTTTVTIPASLITGTYYLGAIADKYNQQLEMVETNNALTGVAIPVRPDVDLVMTKISAPWLPYDGDTRASYTIKNQGGSQTPRTNGSMPMIGIYLSTDAIITTADTIIGYGSIPQPGLEAGQSFTGDAYVQIPPSLVPGSTYYLGAIADQTDIVDESDETNNALTGAAMTVVRDVDLMPTAGSGPATIATGVWYPNLVSVTVKNQGTTPSLDFINATMYLSKDATITNADYWFGQSQIGRMAPGASSTVMFSGAAAYNLAPGTYYLGAIFDDTNVQVESNETNNVWTGAPVTVYIGADLVMTAVSTTATNLPLNGGITVSTTVKNQGTAQTWTASNYVGIYLSTDPIITTADTMIGGSYTGPLAAGASLTTNIGTAIPGNLPPGSYYLGAIADYANSEPESNETNNAITGAALSTVHEVDLVMTAVSTTASSLEVGGSAVINSTVKNQGASSSDPFYVGIYLSTDATITNTDTLVGVRPLWWGVYAGTSESDATTVNIPFDLATGTYYLGAIADYSNGISETNETNNAITGAAITVVSNVDLVMTGVSTSATSLTTGGNATVSNTLKNQGTAPIVVGSTIGIYLSTDAIITPADVLIGTVTVPSLAAGASLTSDTNVSIPSNLLPGTYYLGALADYTNAQSEAIETNNSLTGAIKSVIPNVDLVMTAVSTSATSLTRGGTASVSTTENNQGTQATTASNIVGIYLSTDATITTADTLIGTTTLNSLAAGASSTVNTTVNIPSTLVPGTYYIGAIADYSNAQPETDETNNALTGATKSVIANVDLVMTVVSTTSTSAKVGTSITVSNTEKNQGTQATTISNNVVGIYLSTDATITTADTLIGSRTVSSLTAGATSAASTNATVPSTLAPGTYYLGVLADKNNIQPETNETNNALTKTGTITITP